MKRKHIIFTITAILLVVYIPLSPVFVESTYGTQPKANFPNSDGYSYLWLTREDSFQSFLIFGIYRYDLRGTANIMFRSKKGNLKALSIANVALNIDGVRQEFRGFTGTEIEMDSGRFNGYGGNGSSGSIKFSLSQIPQDEVEFMISGISTTPEGRIPFDFIVKSQIEKTESTICLFQYLIGLLTQT